MIGIVEITPIFGKYAVSEFGMPCICNREELAKIIADKVIRQLNIYLSNNKDCKAVSLGLCINDTKPIVVET